MAYSLVWLPQVLRDAGLKVVEQPGWQTRGHGDVGQIRGVLCHHTAGGKTGNAPSLGIVTNGRPDLAGPLAQLVLARDGTYYVIAAGLCWHAGAGIWQGITTGNSSFIGIEAENTGLPNDSPWPEIQMDAYRRGVAAILKKIGAPVIMCAGHKEYALPHGRKPDPDFDMVMFRAQVAAILGGAGTSKPPAPPVVLPKPPVVPPTNIFERESPRIISRLLKEFPILKDIHGAAACGSFGQETGEYTVFKQSGGGNGIGLAQFDGDRHTKFVAWCAHSQPPRDPLSIDAGLDYVVIELKGSERVAFAALSKTTTLQEATRIFSEKYERPGKPMMENRIRYAERALAAYRATAPKPPPPAPPAPKGTGFLAWLASLVRRNA